MKSAEQQVIVKWRFCHWLEADTVHEVGGGSAYPAIGYEPDPVHLTPSLSLASHRITCQGETFGLALIHKEAAAGHNRSSV